jgi:hypothetical protein
LEGIICSHSQVFHFVGVIILWLVPLFASDLLRKIVKKTTVSTLEKKKEFTEAYLWNTWPLGTMGTGEINDRSGGGNAK